MTKEDSLQIAVADYLRLQYPYVLFCHIPNGGSRNAIEGAKLKRMGVKGGMPDIMIFKADIKRVNIKDAKFNFGLFLELKIKPNKPTKNQIEIMANLRDEGWAGDVCYDFESAKKLIDNYLK